MERQQIEERLSLNSQRRAKVRNALVLHRNALKGLYHHIETCEHVLSITQQDTWSFEWEYRKYENVFSAYLEKQKHIKTLEELAGVLDAEYEVLSFELRFLNEFIGTSRNSTK